MIAHPAQRNLILLSPRCLHKSSINFSQLWLPKRTRSTLLQRQIIRTERDYHFLRVASLPATRELEAEAARGVLEVEIEGTGEVEEAAVVPISRKKLGAQSGRMSIRLSPHLHPD